MDSVDADEKRPETKTDVVTPATPSEETAASIAARLGLKPGDVVEKYEIVRLLGEGGMGAVYEARHRLLGRVVAIKILKPEVAWNPQFAGRFLAEAKSAAELQHRNIVNLTDFGIEGDRPYMVMELLRGESLDHMMKRCGMLTVPHLVGIMDPILKALAFAHERGIVHRDIKPDNIFLQKDAEGDEPTPKIVDFGIAKRQDDAVKLTTDHMALGTPAYMAPEQIMASRNATGAADQYAIGITMYEALTGRYPFDADTINAFIVAKATQDPIPLTAFRADIEPHFAAIVMRTLSRKPEDRYPSVSALREAILPYGPASVTRTAVDAIANAATLATPLPPSLTHTTPGSRTLPAGSLSSGPAPASAVSPSARTPGPVEVPAPVTAVAPAAPPSRTGLWVGVGVAFAAVLAAGGFAISRGSAQSTHVEPSAAPSTVTPPAGQVMFTVRVTEPATAAITLDGEPIGIGQAQVLRARDGRRHQLEIRADGYQPYSEVFDSDGDQNISTRLQPMAAPSAAPSVAQTVGVGLNNAIRHGRGPTPSTAPAQPSQAPVVVAPVEHPAEHPVEHTVEHPVEHPDPPQPSRDPRHPLIRDNPFAQ